MNTQKKLLALVGAGALAFMAVGTTLATGASDSGAKTSSLGARASTLHTIRQRGTLREKRHPSQAL